MSRFLIQVNGESMNGLDDAVKMYDSEYEFVANMTIKDKDKLLELLERAISSNSDIFNYNVVRLGELYE